MNNFFIILAAGKGKRFNSNIPKAFYYYKGKPLIQHSIDKAKKCKKINKIILTINKSHKKYGFIEPIKYFTPSIAISEIIVVDPKFNGIKEKQILVGSMGSSIEEGDLSLHYFLLDNKLEIIKHEILEIKERVRDIVYIEKINKIFLFLESSASIGILETKN